MQRASAVAGARGRNVREAGLFTLVRDCMPTAWSNLRMRKNLLIATLLALPAPAHGKQTTFNVLLAGGSEANVIHIGLTPDGHSYVINSIVTLEVGGIVCANPEGDPYKLLGRGGSDCLFGGPGDDRLIGGRGRDVCSGGIGGDLDSCERARFAGTRGCRPD